MGRGVARTARDDEVCNGITAGGLPAQKRGQPVGSSGDDALLGAIDPSAALLPARRAHKRPVELNDGYVFVAWVQQQKDARIRWGAIHMAVTFSVTPVQAAVQFEDDR